jgi:hypothetical protein
MARITISIIDIGTVMMIGGVIIEVEIIALMGMIIGVTVNMGSRAVRIMMGATTGLTVGTNLQGTRITGAQIIATGNVIAATCEKNWTPPLSESVWSRCFHGACSSASSAARKSSTPTRSGLVNNATTSST